MLTLSLDVICDVIRYLRNAVVKSYCTVRDWNCLPDEAVHTSIPEHFRDYILP